MPDPPGDAGIVECLDFMYLDVKTNRLGSSMSPAGGSPLQGGAGKGRLTSEASWLVGKMGGAAEDVTRDHEES